MNTITQNIWSDEAIASKNANFDFNLLFNYSGSGINYTEVQEGFTHPETTIQLEGLRKLKNDMHIAYLNRNN